MSDTAAQMREVVLRHLSPAMESKGLKPEDLADDFDFLGDGLVDSFGLLDMIASVEAELGVSFDFEEADPASLTVFGPFCAYIAEQAENGRATAPGEGSSSTVFAQSPARPQIAVSPPTPVTRSAVRRGLGAASVAVYRMLVRVRAKVFSSAIAGGFASFGARSVLQPPIRLKGEARIAIGHGVFVGAGSWFQTLGEGRSPLAIEIGDGTSIAGLCVLSSVESIRIGRKVSLARNVYVADHAHAYDRWADPVLEQGVTDIRPVEIGDGAWLGENVVVLPGARIGQGAVIGANSVVGGEIPPYSVAMGSPARVIRRFGPDEAAAGRAEVDQPVMS